MNRYFQRLLQMLPSFTAYDFSDRGWSDAISATQSSLGLAVSMPSTNLGHLRCRELCAADTFAANVSTRAKAVSMSTLRHHIPYVFELGPQEQVIWPNTGWIVTAMAYGESVRDLAEGYCERKTMSSDDVGHLVDVEVTVAVLAKASKHPALTGFVDLGPEVSNYGGTILMGHRETSSLGVAPPDVFSIAGAFACPFYHAPKHARGTWGAI